MRSHQFDINPTLFSLNAVVTRMRAHVRCRFGKAPLPAKGRAKRDRRYSAIVAAVKAGRQWPRTR